MVITVYGKDASPGCRAVYLVLESLGLEYDKVHIRLENREHLTPEFLQINPQHTVPTLVDGEFIIWDSHAIVAYLASKYGKTDSLYPKDLEKRAIVDQRLHYDSSVSGKTLLEIILGLIRNEQDAVTEKQKTDTLNVYDLLNTFLERSAWIAGDHITIADYCIVPNISSLNLLVPLDDEKYPKVVDWLKEMRKIPFYENTNQVGVISLHGLLVSRMK